MRLHSGILLLALTAVSWAREASVDELGKTAARLRGLSYRPIQAQRVTQSQAGEYVRKLLRLEAKPADDLRWEQMLKLLRLMPAQANLPKMREELLMDQIRGLYDPRKKRYLVVKGSGGKGLEKLMGGMFALMGVKMEDVFTVHELDHAVQDQHFNLLQIEKRVAGNFDRQLAAQCLIEGDATSVMTDFMQESVGQVGLRPPSPPSPMDFTGSPALDGAPRFFRESLTAPYLQGQFFVDTLRWNGGWAAVNAAYRNLPQSYEQILHPAKYGKDLPVPVQLKVKALPGYHSMGQDTGGEFTLRCWARNQNESARISSGWGGDRFELFQGPGGAYVVWSTVWDQEHDAVEFAEFLSRFMGSGGGRPGQNGDYTTWTSPTQRLSGFRRKARTVLLYLNAPPGFAPP